MSKSIAQTNPNASDLSGSIMIFMDRFHIGTALKAANAYKVKGIPVITIFQQLFSLVFTHMSMYAGLKSSKHSYGFCKDTVYRFLNMACINWNRFTTMLALCIVNIVFIPAGGRDMMGKDASLIVDDSVLGRNRSKSVELLSKVFDHAHGNYLKGGWTDGISFLPASSVLLSSENKKNRYTEALEMDRRSNGYKRRHLAVMKGTDAMLELLKGAKKAGLPAKDVLFDSWFASPKTLLAVKGLGFEKTSQVPLWVSWR